MKLKCVALKNNLHSFKFDALLNGDGSIMVIVKGFSHITITKEKVLNGTEWQFSGPCGCYIHVGGAKLP